MFDITLETTNPIMKPWSVIKTMTHTEALILMH